MSAITNRTARLWSSDPGKNAARESKRRKASLKPAGSRWSRVEPFRYDHGVKEAGIIQLILHK